MTAEFCDAGNMRLQMDKDVSLLLHQEIWKSEPKERRDWSQTIKDKKSWRKIRFVVHFPGGYNCTNSKKKPGHILFCGSATAQLTPVQLKSHLSTRSSHWEASTGLCYPLNRVQESVIWQKPQPCPKASSPLHRRDALTPILQTVPLARFNLLV